MNRLTRLATLLTVLQNKRTHKAEDLARRFEVSVRTIYRDMRTLQEAGVPIGGEAGVGYYLVDGYTLSPVAFSEEEAQALVTAAALVQQQSDASLKQHYGTALEKVKAVLKASQKEAVDLLEQRQGPSVLREQEATTWLTDLQKAITQRQAVQLVYGSAGGAVTERAVEPVGIYFTADHWIMVGFCRLRQALREFRLDRMKAVTFTDQEFAPRFFDLEHYFRQQSEG